MVPLPLPSPRRVRTSHPPPSSPESKGRKSKSAPPNPLKQGTKGIQKSKNGSRKKQKRNAKKAERDRADPILVRHTDVATPRSDVTETCHARCSSVSNKRAAPLPNTEIVAGPQKASRDEINAWTSSLCMPPKKCARTTPPFHMPPPINFDDDVPPAMPNFASNAVKKPGQVLFHPGSICIPDIGFMAPARTAALQQERLNIRDIARVRLPVHPAASYVAGCSPPAWKKGQGSGEIGERTFFELGPATPRHTAAAYALHNGGLLVNTFFQESGGKGEAVDCADAPSQHAAQRPPVYIFGTGLTCVACEVLPLNGLQQEVRSGGHGKGSASTMAMNIAMHKASFATYYRQKRRRMVRERKVPYGSDGYILTRHGSKWGFAEDRDVPPRYCW